MLRKAATLDADAFVLDLEDGVAPAAKADARTNIRSLLAEADFGGREVAVRINGLDTRWFLDDLLAIETMPVDAVIVPKVHRPDDVVAVATILQQFALRGRQDRLTLQILIESARGLEAVGEIVRASPLLTAVIFGAGDYAADSGASLTPRGLAYARARIAAAAAAACIDAIDYVHAQIKDDEGLRTQVEEAKELGYSGKWAIHPQQVPVINRGFSPSMEDVAEATRLIALYDQAKQSGIGALSADGVMVDEAVLRTMRRRMALAQRIGVAAG